MQPLEPLTKPETSRRTGHRTLLLRRALINLLIWLGLNVLVFTIVSFAVFYWINPASPAEADSAFFTSLLCAVPAALGISGVIVARRVVREFKG